MTEEIKTTKELLEKTPKARQILLDWVRQQMESFQKASIPKDMEVELPPIPEEDVEFILTSQFLMNPRLFFDAFDAHNIYIGIIWAVAPNWFHFKINGEEMESLAHEGRLETEKAAIKAALQILEKNKDENTKD